jgi:hypothetical protein
MLENEENNSLLKNESSPNDLNISFNDNSILQNTNNNINSTNFNDQLPQQLPEKIRPTYINPPHPQLNPSSTSSQLSPDKIHSFVFILTLFFTLSTIQNIIPQLVVLISYKTVNYSNFFSKAYWLLIILTIIFISVIVIVFFVKQKLLTAHIGYSIPLFIVYLLSMIFIFTFTAFYSIALTLGITLIQLTLFGVLLLLEKINAVKTKYHIKLTIVFVLGVVEFIVYCIVVKSHIVGCFIYVVFLLLFCTYAVFQFKEILKEFKTKYNVDVNKDLPLMYYAIAMMNSHVDVFVCCFR